MGKSTSCFKLITCGGDSEDKDDYQVSEIKDSNDKRGWSFRKRSARHRVLNNTVITETPSSANKDSSECTSINSQPLAEPNVVEKTYAEHMPDEKPQLSSLASSQLSETIATETESKVDVDQPDSVVVITIQAAIRGFLAQRSLLKLKNVVKLQAAARGHLVRMHAVGTLRCVQAIVKMQLRVRARRAQQSHPENHLNHKGDKNDCSTSLGNENPVTKSNVTYTSIEKLLSNRFACQLLESTPKNKPIRVKCDPSKADSAWKWLERWMSVSSKNTVEYKTTISMAEQSYEIKDSTSVSQMETVIPSEVCLQSADSEPTAGDSLLPSKDEEKATANDASNLNFQVSPSTSSLVKDNLEQAPPEKTITYDGKATSTEIDSLQNEEMESDASAPQELSSFPQKPEIDGEQSEQSMISFASDQLETEGKKYVNGSRKFSNPAPMAAQSKFEELSSMADSGRSSSLSYQDAAVESRVDTSSVAADTAYRSKELFSSENSAPHRSRIGGSECGTELSISSTLDSPDILDDETLENKHEAKDLVEGIGNQENTINHDDVANVPCAILIPNLPNSDLGQSEIVDDISGNMDHSAVAGDSKEPASKSNKSSSDLLREQAETVLQDSRLSPEASPTSRITISESQETPSSQVSIKPKESKIKKTGSRNKRKILSVGNKSPANANDDSGSKGSREQLPKDQRSGKRRNSFGSVKPDHIDQEIRDNSSNSNSLPHFMQATESARAKINAHNSPRSSPDVHDQDIPIKKRHSLPGATGRQGSPRIHRSTSQAQQSTKGNDVNPLHERKWQR